MKKYLFLQHWMGVFLNVHINGPQKNCHNFPSLVILTTEVGVRWYLPNVVGQQRDSHSAAEMSTLVWWKQISFLQQKVILLSLNLSRQSTRHQTKLFTIISIATVDKLKIEELEIVVFRPMYTLTASGSQNWTVLGNCEQTFENYINSYFKHALQTDFGNESS